MKTTLKSFLLLLVGLMLMPVAASAQGLDAQLPLDPEVRYGVLPNGLTYYIRHNEYPKGQADFYIAQKVGSILEEDNQQGLAHFLEHMCFNGTKSFPGNELISWLESVGVKFGQNLNAYTSVDKTVYNISNVPVARTGVQDSCLMILHDWADGLLLDPEEIDKERGVIHQEYMRSNQGNMRILKDLLPTLYPDSKYAHRLPIGTLDVIDNFKPQEIRDYYETWYRPDQQGIMVVGDIDVDRIEGKIKELFGPIEMPANPKPRVYYPVPDHKGTIYAIGKDPEMPMANISIMYLSEATPDSLKNTMAYYMESFVQHMVESMLKQRLNDLSLDPNAVFANAGADFDNYILAKTKDAFDVSGIAKNGDVLPVAETIYRELLRAARGGFTQSEYDRALEQYNATLDRWYNNRSTRENGSYIDEYVKHFTDGEAAPGMDTDYQIQKMIAQMIPLEAINSYLPEVVTPDNRVVLAMIPDKPGVPFPTEEQVKAVLDKVDGETIEAFVDEVKAEPLIPVLPAKGSIVSTSTDNPWGATEWTLSNGIKVLVKPTKFKEDEIVFSAVANGGSAVFSDDYAATLSLLPMSSSVMSLGDYTSKDLSKYLMGKNVAIHVSIDDYTRDVDGSTTPKDLPYLMELIYSGFTAPGLDANEFEATRSSVLGLLSNMESNPQFIFQNDVAKALYTSPRQLFNKENVQAARLDQSVEVLKQALKNPADYTFLFVGNVDLDVLRPLVEQYIASLPTDPANATKGMPAFIPETQMKGGKGIDTFSAPMQTPQTFVYIEEWGNMPYDTKNSVIASVAGQILSKRLLESVREREGAVYSIGAQGYMRRVSPQNTHMLSSFPMTPDKKELVLGMIETEFDNMTKDITTEELQKIQEYLVKSYREGLEKNNYWAGHMAGYFRNNVDNLTGYEALVNSLTPADIQNFMKQLNAQGNYRVVILDPAN